MKHVKNPFKNFGLFAIALCAVCCSLPVAGTLAGIGTFALLSHYLAWAAVAGVTPVVVEEGPGLLSGL